MRSGHLTVSVGRSTAAVHMGCPFAAVVVEPLPPQLPLWMDAAAEAAGGTGGRPGRIGHTGHIARPL